MKWLYLILFFLPGVVFSQTIQKRELYAERTTTPPKIDGITSDEVWNQAPVATDLFMYNPVFGSNATKKTEVRILYDDVALYVCAILYDNAPDSILRELGSRDESVNADAFYIGFDTYNRLDAYVFSVTASGVQAEVKDSDPTFDAVWESAVKINETGWCVEMKIPYSAIRFPSADEQEWGFQFTRMIKRTEEYDQWASTPKGVSNGRLYWGKLKGIRNIKAPLRLSLSPFISGLYEHSPLTNADGSVNFSNSFNYNFGADLKYGIDEKFTIDMTLLPDFNQVQSDNKVKNLSYQEITYNENRSFFKESTELFNKDVLFYSRRIGKTPMGYASVSSLINPGESILENPATTRLLNAIKFSGRNNNGQGIGFFNAITDNMYARLEDSLKNQRTILTEPLTNYNIVVFDQQFKNNSNFYLINTNVLRAKGFPAANVTGTGLTLFEKKSRYAMDIISSLSQQYLKNDTIENNFTAILGYKYFMGIRKASGNFQFGISHLNINKTFDTRDLGYYTIGNKINEKVYVAYNFYKPTKWFRESYNTLTANYAINPETGKCIKNDINLDLYTVLNNFWVLSSGTSVSPMRYLDYYEPRTEGRFSVAFRWYYSYLNINTDPKKDFSFDMHFEGGNFIEKFQGPGFGTSLSARYRVNNHLQVRYTFGFNDDTYNIGFVSKDTSGNIFYGGRELVTFSNTFNMKYIFKNDMYLLLNIRHYWNTGDYSRYFLLEDNGELTEKSDYDKNHDFSYNIFNIDLIYSWQFAPGSTLSVVYKNYIENETNNPDELFFKNFQSTWQTPQKQTLSLKLLYYLDYQNLRKSKRNII